ncbi:MAG TPA: hypothetical protein VGN23_01305 [Verrucomicrobiae bacterium]|jgi:hypothetical protein
MADDWTLAICNGDAQTAYNNCLLKADCTANPAPANNCCVDGCDETYNSSCESAWDTQANTIGQASAQEQSDFITIPATQAHGDAIARALYTFTTAQDSITKITTEALAGDVLAQSISTDQNQYTEDAANCVCKYPTDQNQQTLCVTAAATKQTGNDKTAQAVYNAAAAEPPVSPVGAAYAACYNADQAALTAEQTTLTTDQNTCNANLTKAQNTFNNVWNTQIAIYNTAVNKASKALNSCKKGCGVS